MTEALESEALEDIVKEGEELKAEEAAEAAVAAFEEGFSGKKAPEEEKEEKTEEKQEVKEDPKKEEAEQEIKEAVKEEVKAEEKFDPQVLSRLRKVEGTLGELTSRVRTMQRAGNKAAEEQGAKSPSKEQVEQAMESSQKWEELKEEFPEWVEAAEEKWALQEKRLEKRLENLIPSDYMSKEEVSKLLDEQKEALKQELRKERELEKVDNKYPEWQTTTDSPEFLAWLRVQDQETLLLYESDYASDVIKLLDQYEGWKKQTSQKEVSQKQTQRLEKAIPPTTRSATPPSTVKTAEEAFAEGFNS